MRKARVSFSILLKAVAMISIPALATLAFFVLTEALDLTHFLAGYLAIVALSAVLIYPILSNIASLTFYVNDLAEDRKVTAPNLTFLSTVTELSESLSFLQRSWERKRQQMESIITEREILVDTLPDILIMINDDRTIVRTNRAARNIFGQNLAGRALRDIIGSDVLMTAVNAVAQDLRGREVEFRLDDVVPRDFLAIIERFPIPSVGGISTIITLNDITQLKSVEQMRADFVANASHEIRTPLASIIGFIETLRGPAKDDPAAREEFLRVMAEQAERMQRLIMDLLSLSKIEMNANTVPSGKVDILRVVRNEKQNYEWAALQKNMTIRLDLNDNLPLVRGDENELTQIVHNLISNAVKYGYANSEITITGRITNDLPQEMYAHNIDRAVCVAVRDRGEGIPKKHIPRLTERFYRVDSARTRKIGGTGLGLAIVKHILNRHLGSITIDSEVGEGSTFNIFLPLYEEA